MKDSTTSTHSEINFIFWAHVVITLAAWIIPFLFWWPVVWAVYIIVHVQFAIFGRCLVNKMHDLDEEDDKILYTYMLEAIGFHPNRRKLKIFIRKILYPVLAVFAVIWQVVLGMKPLIF